MIRGDQISRLVERVQLMLDLCCVRKRRGERGGNGGEEVTDSLRRELAMLRLQLVMLVDGKCSRGGACR